MLRSLHFHWKEHDFSFKSKEVSLYGLALQTVFDNVIRLILLDKQIAPNIQTSHRNLSTLLYHGSTAVNESDVLAGMLSMKMRLLLTELIKRKDLYMINFDINDVVPLTDE